MAKAAKAAPGAGHPLPYPDESRAASFDLSTSGAELSAQCSVLYATDGTHLSKGDDVMSAIYTAIGTATGREGRARTNDGKLDLQLARPVEMGGDGEGTNPEQLFAMGYSACFASALSLVATFEEDATAPCPR